MEFRIRSGKNFEFPFFVVVVVIGFIQREQLHKQTQNKNAFYQASVTNADCIICTENYPYEGRNYDFEHDKFSRAYGENFFSFRHLTMDNTLQPIFTRTILPLLKSIQQTISLGKICMFLRYDTIKSLLLLNF